MVPINCVQHEFRSMRMIVLWSFLALPSHPSSMASHYVTTRDTPERVEGMTAGNCCEYFGRECWTMEEELRRFMYLDEIGNNPTEPVTIPLQRYFADGTVLTPQAAEYMKMLSMRTLTLGFGPPPRPKAATG